MSKSFLRGESWAVAHAQKFAQQDYELLKQELKSFGRIFEDLEFPPERIKLAGGNVDDVEWLRPKVSR